MGVKYDAVIWNAQKKRYDLLLWAFILLFAFSFVLGHLWLHPNSTPETLVIRTTALIAIILLHFILMIGPLCRLNTAFLPLLYNRRHLGVTMFLFAAVHSVFSIVQFHALGDIHPLASIFLSNTKYASISSFPFQTLGFFALIILFLMAATSHDFWLKNLSPKTWKFLHMGVYLAYALVILHVALGILQYEKQPVFWVLLLFGFFLIALLHLASGIKGYFWLKAQKKALRQEDFYQVAAVDEIPDDCAKAVFVDGQNIAIFKYENKLSAVSNVCRHQMGPLAEGRIVDGCITCPWHGYQYKPHDGQSPPPYTEKLETYQLRMLDKSIWVNPKPEPAGTFVEPVIFKGGHFTSQDAFYIGWQDRLPEKSNRAIKKLLFAAGFSLVLLAMLINYKVKPFNDHSFELFQVKEFQGLYYAEPFPVLVLHPDQSPIPGQRHALLVGYGKNGARSFIEPYEAEAGSISGKEIHLRGTLIYGDGKVLIELTEKTASILGVGKRETTEGPDTRESAEGLNKGEGGQGEVQHLQGEILDPKCWFGVMKPGEGKVHKSCAIRCISGGIPPVFRAGTGAENNYYLLRDLNGLVLNDNKDFLNLIGEPIQLQGRAERVHGWQVLTIDFKKAKAQIKQRP